MRKPYTFKNRKTLLPLEKKQARKNWLSNNKKRHTCTLCNYGSCNRSNLLIHYKRKKHLKNVKLQEEKIIKIVQSLISFQN